MELEPELRRQYLWERGNFLLLESVELRRQGRTEEARWIGQTGRFLLDNIDQLVEISGKDRA